MEDQQASMVIGEQPAMALAHRLPPVTTEVVEGAACTKRTPSDQERSPSAMPCYRILAADGDPAMQRFHRETLPALGHQVCVVGSGRLLVDVCLAVQPDMVITALTLPERYGLAAAADICRVQSLPFIVVADGPNPPMNGCTLDIPLLGCLVKPIQPDSLAPTILVAMQRFEQLRAMCQETMRLRQNLEDRKLIERAKGLVVRYCGLDEETAYHQMKNLANKRNRKLADLAHDIITAGEVFRHLGRSGDVSRPATSRLGAEGEAERNAAPNGLSGT